MPTDCLGRIPYASVIGFIMVFVGAGIMCGTLYEGTKRTGYMFEARFYVLPQLAYVQTGGFIAASVVVLLAIFMLVFGVLTTGATRGKMYRGDRFLMGGRCTASIFVFLTYLINGAWMVMTCLLVVPVTGWIIFQKVCKEETEYWASISEAKSEAPFTYNFTLRNYGFYNSDAKAKDTINTVDEFARFCTQISTIGPLYGCSFGGAICVILGLVTFLGSLSANLVRLKYTKELTEFRDAAMDHRDTEMDNMNVYPGSQFGGASSYHPSTYQPPGSNYPSASYPPGSSVI